MVFESTAVAISSDPRTCSVFDHLVPMLERGEARDHFRTVTTRTFPLNITTLSGTLAFGYISGSASILISYLPSRNRSRLTRNVAVPAFSDGVKPPPARSVSNSQISFPARSARIKRIMIAPGKTFGGRSAGSGNASLPGIEYLTSIMFSSPLFNTGSQSSASTSPTITAAVGNIALFAVAAFAG